MIEIKRQKTLMRSEEVKRQYSPTMISGVSEVARVRLGCHLIFIGIVIPLLLVGLDVSLGQIQHAKGAVEMDGDIILGGLFPIHKKSEETENACGLFSEIPGYQFMEAMVFAIDKINNDASLLPGIKLGAQIYDSCQSHTIAADRAKEFIKLTLTQGKVKLAGVIGALSSGVSATVANFLRVFEIPQISYSSTSVTLSNKDIYSYFLRTVAPDSFQAQAMVDIIVRFGWSYVSTVNSAGDYGTKGMEIFWKKAKENNICIDHKEQLAAFTKPSEYEQVVRRLVTRSKESNVSVVVIFATQTDARHLLEAARVTPGTERFTYIGSDGWSNRNDVTATAGDAALGALTVTIRRGEVLQEFKEHFTGLNWKNYSRTNKRCFQEFWENKFKCHIPGTDAIPNGKNYNSSCTGSENLADVPVEFSPVRVVINAVYAFAHALHNLQKELCPGQTGMCSAMSHFQRSQLLKYLKNVTFRDITLNTTVKFDQNSEVNAMYDIMNLQKSNGTYNFVRVGAWDGELVGGKIKKKFVIDSSKIRWLKGSLNTPVSYCSSDCKPGAIRTNRQSFDYKCCWKCKRCGELQSVVNNTCVDGPEGWLPDANRTGWVKREVLYPKWSDTPSVALIIISMICLLLTFTTSTVYIVRRKHRLVKASGRELCYVMLAGIALCFLTPFLFIAKPNDPLCYTRNLVTALALAMCYAPLFMKVNRIYRIFTSAKSSVARPPLVTPRMQLLVTFALVSIQLMFTTLWFIAKPVRAEEMYHRDTQELVLECKVDELSFSVNLCYVMVLMILCTAYAFKTRNFPKNFNESKYIGVTMYITCGVWMLFFPFYLNTTHSFTHIYLICGTCVTIGFVTLTGLFAQKIYIVFFVSEIQTDDLVMTSRSIQRRATAREESQQISNGDVDIDDK